MWQWGTSNPAMISATRVHPSACFCAEAMSFETLKQCCETSSGRSVHWSTSSLGTTRRWPREMGLIVMKATQCSSWNTKVPGSSPVMMRVNSDAIGFTILPEA